ncbi:hypothetical protein [Streptomyces sp. NPDC045251]|uniref:hypothetical protein n=1 Tax=unclassified Streptomyces TaxID=2593676 RepID=UPI0033CE5EB9
MTTRTPNLRLLKAVAPGSSCSHGGRHACGRRSPFGIVILEDQLQETRRISEDLRGHPAGLVDKTDA